MKFFNVLLGLTVFFITVGNAYCQDDKREQYVQRTLSLRAAEDYVGAIAVLDSFLMDHPEEVSLLLLRGDLCLQGANFKEAVNTYSRLIPLEFEPITARINLSYALFMDHKPKKALEMAKAAWEIDQNHKSATVNYFNAMLWNVQTKNAKEFLEANISKLTAADKLVLSARLYTSSGDFKRGLGYYEELVNLEASKHYVKEYGDVLMAKSQVKKSDDLYKANTSILSESDMAAHHQKVKELYKLRSGAQLSFFKDVGGNVRWDYALWSDIVKKSFLEGKVSTGKSVYTAFDANKTTSAYIHLNLKERYSSTLSGNTEVHLQEIRPLEGDKFVGVTGSKMFTYQPNDRRMLGLGYTREILSFTASIINQNIRNNSLGYVTHIMLDGKTGLFSQGNMGKLTDSNEKFQFFGSFYHVFNAEPLVKTGINYSTLHFTNQEITEYFSPDKYKNLELFADLNLKQLPIKHLQIAMQGAAGMQKIEDRKIEKALRFQTELGYQVKDMTIGLKYQSSNVASSTGVGYKFNWLTFNFTYKW